MKINIYLFILLSLIFIIKIEGIGMWGSRKKKTSEEELKSTDFETLLQKANAQENQRSNKKIKEKSSNINKKSSNIKSSQTLNLDAKVIQETIELFLTLIEDLIDSSEFDDILTYDNIKKTILNIPEVKTNSQLLEILLSKELRNPKILKQTLKEGLKTAKEYVMEIVNLINHKEFINEYIPQEYHDLFISIMNGDYKALKDIVRNLAPYMTSNQSKLVDMIIDGLISSSNNNSNNNNIKKIVIKTVQEMVNDMSVDEINIEHVREMLLEQPALGLLLGIITYYHNI
jgi:hypothetical protein